MKKQDLRELLVNGSTVVTADHDIYMVVYSDLFETNLLISTESGNYLEVGVVTEDMYVHESKVPDSKIVLVFPKEAAIIEKDIVRIKKDAVPTYDIRNEISEISACTVCAKQNCDRRKELETTDKDRNAEMLLKLLSALVRE